MAYLLHNTSWLNSLVFFLFSFISSLKIFTYLLRSRFIELSLKFALIPCFLVL